MGGVDLLDMMVATYRILFRRKKWYFSIYTWSLTVAAVNAWRLRMKWQDKQEPYLDFLRELVIGMMHKHGHVRKVERMVVKSDDKRKDGPNHWIVHTEAGPDGKPKRRNCKLCLSLGEKDSKALFMCEKCEIPLHVTCFKNYHLNE